MQRHPLKWSLSNNISTLPTLNLACLSKPFMWLSNQNPPTERNACTVEGLIYRNYIKLTQVLVRKDLDTLRFGMVSPDGRGRPTPTSRTSDPDSLGSIAPVSSFKAENIAGAEREQNKSSAENNSRWQLLRVCCPLESCKSLTRPQQSLFCCHHVLALLEYTTLNNFCRWALWSVPVTNVREVTLYFAVRICMNVNSLRGQGCSWFHHRWQL